ncbi:serine/threonine protein kinase [Nonomuraea dietziae]|uniref:serine/threonine protein kinase n=1 Tax=Nonomuraea dietziae TaxID=65515 RepID=UPI0031CE67C3
MAVGGAEDSLGSRYVLLDEIGAGAMGTVWRGRHRDSGEIVAVKLLRDSLSGDHELVLRFVQERNVMKSLRHPHIVAVRDFVIEGERLALVMDFVEGGDLRTLLQRQGTLPPAQAARLMAQVADALAAAHALDVVHRDVKPGNVLIDRATGQVRLTDFGVARIVHGPGLTQTTSVIGTPTYLSPEVADGSAPTAAVDVYALGLILYELLAGRPPFVGDHPMALLRQHATAAPRRLPGMPDVLWPVIAACTAKDPARRPAAAQVAAALRQAAPSLAAMPALPAVARGEAPSVTSEPLSATGPRPCARDRGLGPAPVAQAAAGRRRGGRGGAGAQCGGPWPSWRRGGRPTRGASPSLAVASAVSTPQDPSPPLPAVGTEVGTAKSTPPQSPKERTVRRRPQEATVSEQPERPATAKQPVPRVTTPRPRRTTEEPVEPPRESRQDDIPAEETEPNWRCRSWITTGTGTDTEMSPCMAVVGEVLHVKGRIRGSTSVSSDIHVQLFNTDADANVSQPFICSGVSPSSEGEIVTCGPFTTTAARTGAKLDVRQRWKRTGTATFGGGAESPYTVW